MVNKSLILSQHQQQRFRMATEEESFYDVNVSGGKFGNLNPLPSKWPDISLPDFSTWTAPPFEKFANADWKECIPKIPKLTFNLKLPNISLPKFEFPGFAMELPSLPGLPGLPSLPLLPDLTLGVDLDILPEMADWEAGDIDITGLEMPKWPDLPDCAKPPEQGGKSTKRTDDE